MYEEIFEVIFILIGIVLVLLIINFFRNYFILKNIYEIGNSFDPGQNFHINKISKMEISDIEEIVDFYYKDGKYLKIEEQKNIDTGISDKDISFYDENTNEHYKIKIDENGNIITNETENQNNESNYIEQMIYCNSYDFGYLLKKHIFKTIRKEENRYVFSSEKETDIYVNKKTGLMERLISEKLGYDVKFIFEENTVKDEDINKYNNWKLQN